MLQICFHPILSTTQDVCADVVQNGVVDIEDLLKVLGDFGDSGKSDSDVVQDSANKVNIEDLLAILSAYGQKTKCRVNGHSEKQEKWCAKQLDIHVATAFCDSMSGQAKLKPKKAIETLCNGATKDLKSIKTMCGKVGVKATAKGLCLNMGFTADTCNQVAEQVNKL